jgi:hypothetical protein
MTGTKTPARNGQSVIRERYDRYRVRLATCDDPAVRWVIVQELNNLARAYNRVPAQRTGRVHRRPE